VRMGASRDNGHLNESDDRASTLVTARPRVLRVDGAPAPPSPPTSAIGISAPRGPSSRRASHAPSAGGQGTAPSSEGGAGARRATAQVRRVGGGARSGKPRPAAHGWPSSSSTPVDGPETRGPGGFSGPRLTRSASRLRAAGPTASTDEVGSSSAAVIRGTREVFFRCNNWWA
jgi:hypothetical protein